LLLNGNYYYYYYYYFPPPSYLYSDLVVGLALSEFLESSEGGNVAAVRVSLAGQFRDDVPDEKGYPSPPGCVLAVKAHSSPHTKRLCPENLTDASERNREEWRLLFKLAS
jgi:hypothetical protein